MALYEERKVNANTVIVKDTNDPANEGYRLTVDEWKKVKALEGDYNAQVALANEYDRTNRTRTDIDEQIMDTQSQGQGERQSDRESNEGVSYR